ncbi:MBL fold metallo-hydrolase [Devosia nitrariae]|uniref:MBL fold metallo-hydrolase n=1 Tax=Devosia nitrariae TaxID=2071872 RepID=A0ABQ5W542_9HYPH|nr:MBL fold metallo-hydrolase [Devosia nitrariae]GLQ54979.1 MBL fold metallo-hydrolase [Devosia nitrariae]
MAQPAPQLVFDKGFDPQTGTPVAAAPGVTRVTAPNAGPYTFTGTNSFLIGNERLFLLDPGPDDARHAEALLAAIGARPVEAILLTHTHRDHSSLAASMAQRLRAPLWFGGPHRLSRPARRGEINAVDSASDWALKPDQTLVDGKRLAIDGIELKVIATPGHCANHLAFGLVGTDVLFSGDHVMGWNSTLVSVPDGSMSDYLASLDRVLAAPYRLYLPAHGGPIADGLAYARALKAHRYARNGQILEAVRAGAHSIGAITRKVYPGLALKLLPAARMTVGAHVEHLEERGMLRVSRGLWGRRVESV